MSDEEAEERAREITEQLGWEEDYYLISAATGKNVPPLCRDIMDFIIANPREAEIQQVAPKEVKFKWEDYHQEQLAEHQSMMTKIGMMIGPKKMMKELSSSINLKKV